MNNNLDVLINKQLKSDWTFEQRLKETYGYNRNMFSYFANRILSFNYPTGKVEFNMNAKVAVFRLNDITLAEFEFTDEEVLVAHLPVVRRINGRKLQLDQDGLLVQVRVTDEYSEKVTYESFSVVATILGGAWNENYKDMDFYNEFGAGDVTRINRIVERPNPTKKPIKLYVENLVSEEHRKVDNILVPVLDKVSVNVYEQDVIGVYGDNKQEVELFMRIFGNMRPFYKGVVRLSEYGVRKNKKEYMENMYYIDSSSALYQRMTVLEQLMFACSAKRKVEEAPKMQRELLDVLVELNLGDIALKKIGTLTVGEKLLVQILVAWLSKSEVIVANFQAFTFTQKEIEVFATVINYINAKGITFMLSTCQPKFIGMTCKRVLFLVDGQVEFDGAVGELTKNWDRVVCVIKGEKLQEIANALETEMYHIKCVIEDDTLYVRNHSEKDWSLNLFYSIMQRKGFEPYSIKFNKGRVENSFNELMVKYDLQ